MLLKINVIFLFRVHGAVRVDKREPFVGGVRARERVRFDAFRVVGKVLKHARGTFDHFRGSVSFLNNDGGNHSKEVG